LLGSWQRRPAGEAALKGALAVAGLAFFVLSASSAEAARLVPFRLMVGGALHFGRELTSDVRAHVGFVYSEDGTEPGYRYFIGLGASGAVGRAAFDDPRGIDGRVSTWRFWVGPELRLGTSLVEDEPHRPVDFYFAIAPIRIQASELSARLPEAGGAYGLRAALGLAVPRSWHITDMVFEPKSCDGGTCALGLLLLAAPNTIELSYERAASANRGGIVLGYTF
jgi:hypothetical protein